MMILINDHDYDQQVGIAQHSKRESPDHLRQCSSQMLSSALTGHHHHRHHQHDDNADDDDFDQVTIVSHRII